MLSIDRLVDDREIVMAHDPEAAVNQLKTSMRYALLDAARERGFVLEGEPVLEEQRDLLRHVTHVRMTSLVRKGK